MFQAKIDFDMANNTQNGLQLLGDKELIAKLENLQTGSRKKIMRKAISKGIKRLQKSIANKAPALTGLLKKSINSRVTKNMAGKIFVDPRVVAVKGANTRGKWVKVNFKGGKGLKINEKISQAKTAAGSDAELRRPSKYAHLVEFGTKHRAKNSFMRDGLQSGRSAALSEVEQGAKQGLQEALK